MLTSSRFMRTELLLGKQGLQNLQNSSVMIIGVGAVGGYALEAVARAGVGHIILVDFDTFDETNINRQILALSSTIGRKKIEVAKERVLDINPQCYVETKDMFVDSSNIASLLDIKVDMVIDAIDSLDSKSQLLEELYKHQIPFISSMGAALRTDATKIKISTLDKTHNCGLAKSLRQRLRRNNIDIKKIKCVYSEEVTSSSGILDNQNPNERRILGSLPTITAIFGLVIANEVIKEITKQ